MDIKFFVQPQTNLLVISVLMVVLWPATFFFYVCPWVFLVGCFFCVLLVVVVLYFISLDHWLSYGYTDPIIIRPPIRLCVHIIERTQPEAKQNK